MRNFNFKITEHLDRRLKAESDRTGAKLSEIVRRAIDEHLSARERGKIESDERRTIKSAS